MNEPDPRIDRLLQAARQACPPPTAPSPWLAQRVIRTLREDGWESDSALRNGILLRALGFGAALVAVSIMLHFLQPQNPYRNALNLVNSTLQLERL